MHLTIQFNLKKGNLDLLIDFNSKINTILLVYILKLDFKIYLINNRAQKIDSVIVNIFSIMLASFLISNKLEKA